MRPSTASHDSFAIHTSQILHPEPSCSILSKRGLTQPHPAELGISSKIGSAFTSQRKRKRTSEDRETGAHLKVS
jgi:hypothetical protein